MAFPAGRALHTPAGFTPAKVSCSMDSLAPLLPAADAIIKSKVKTQKSKTIAGESTGLPGIGVPDVKIFPF